MNKILDSTKFVIENSQSAKINQAKVAEFAKGFEHGTTDHWLSQAPFDFSHFDKEEELRFVFVFNALSFCYWGEPKWTIEHEGKSFDGAWGMIVALGRGIREGYSLLDFQYCSDIGEKDFKAILRANIEIPLFKERLAILHEVGNVMLRKHHGSMAVLLEESGSDVLKLLDIIIRDFPSFRDISPYSGREIYFYKRAQLLTADLRQMISKRGIALKNFDQLTVCADYKLPMMLRKFGILEYTPSLAQKIDQKIEISHNSTEEIEIRANTIWAVEFIKEQVKQRNSKITSMNIGDHIWLMSQEKFLNDKPYHWTRTTAY